MPIDVVFNFAYCRKKALEELEVQYEIGLFLLNKRDVNLVNYLRSLLRPVHHLNYKCVVSGSNVVHVNKLLASRVNNCHADVHRLLVLTQ